MYSLMLYVALLTGQAADEPSQVESAAAKQVAEIQGRLEADRTDYIRRLKAANSSISRDQLMKEAPRSEPYLESMLQVVQQYPNDPAAIDALLWVVSNSPSMEDGSPNARAKAMLLENYSESDRLIPFAVSLSSWAHAANEDALRQLLVRNKSDQVRAATNYALSLQLVSQANMIDVYNLRLETAPTNEARLLIKESLEKDFGIFTAERFRTRSPKELAREAEQLLEGIVSDERYSVVQWPVDHKLIQLGELATRDLDALRSLRPGCQAPATVGKGLAKQKESLQDQRGKVVLLVYWGEWCAACRGMFPLERELSSKYTARPFTIFGVNSDQDREVAVNSYKTEQMTWPVIWDGGSTHGPLATLWNVRGWPLVVIIDHTGMIRYKFSGAPEPAMLQPLVERLVKEAEVTANTKE